MRMPARLSAEFSNWRCARELSPMPADQSMWVAAVEDRAVPPAEAVCLAKQISCQSHPLILQHFFRARTTHWRVSAESLRMRDAGHPEKTLARCGREPVADLSQRASSQTAALPSLQQAAKATVLPVDRPPENATGTRETRMAIVCFTEIHHETQALLVGI